MTMTHPGLPFAWSLAIYISMAVLVIWTLSPSPQNMPGNRYLRLDKLPYAGPMIRLLTKSPWPVFIIRLIMAIIFLVLISAGLFGSPIPERNAATVVTWTVWWSGVIISIFFIGSAWCAICPWDSIASWLVKRHLWKRNDASSLGIKVPKYLRNVWPAIIMFTGLTWLELGVGVTASPYATSLMALFMIIAATASLAIFERKAFCQYFCPVGRTIGFYSQLSLVALRSSDADICAHCKTLDCYHGNNDIDPCPTHLVMGTLNQNTYCTSCGACVLSCPYDNISWRVRPVGIEASQQARPRMDEAWFILGLAALTSFHGITMMPFWEQNISRMASFIGDSGRLLWSFSLGMLVSLLVPVVLYYLAIALSTRMSASVVSGKRLFPIFIFAILPIAFSYHISHNLNHFVNEIAGISSVLTNPFGTGTQPLSMAEIHARQMSPLLSASVLHILQVSIMVFGFWLSVQILRSRGKILITGHGVNTVYIYAPMLLYICVMHVFNIWMLTQPMIMRV